MDSQKVAAEIACVKLILGIKL